MAKQYKKLTQKDKDFINKQKLFYLASGSNAEVNLSPKGYDSIRILNDSQLIFLDFPGSGNRTARDIVNDGEVTLLFNAFEGDALILRLFCKGEIIALEDGRFTGYVERFGVNSTSIRQLFLFDIYAVETSCGEAIPYMEFKAERKSLKNWAKKMSDEGVLQAYIDDHKIPSSLKSI